MIQPLATVTKQQLLSSTTARAPGPLEYNLPPATGGIQWGPQMITQMITQTIGKPDQTTWKWLRGRGWVPQ